MVRTTRCTAKVAFVTNVKRSSTDARCDEAASLAVQPHLHVVSGLEFLLELLHQLELGSRHLRAFCCAI